jgi:hypothetical protein
MATERAAELARLRTLRRKARLAAPRIEANARKLARMKDGA